jgi:LysR family transcriptional regulator for bpeEF and oprC
MDLNSLVIFARVAETRSFTVAADQLDLSASAVSKAVSRLEADLGVLLLHRTTRMVTPTAEGIDLLERCREIIAAIDDAVSSVKGVPGRPTGRLRVVLPVALGHRVIMPALRQLAQQHPDLVFDCELTDRTPDMLYEGVDCAVHLGDVTDQRLVARKLGHLRFFPCASPEYLLRHGEPLTPDDLDHHHCLATLVPQTGRYREWTFRKDGQPVVKQLAGRINVNHGEALLEAAMDGEGIAMLGTYTIMQAVQAKRLKVLLKEYAVEGHAVWLLYPARRNSSPKLRLFIDFMVKLFEGVPAWDREILTGR